MSALRNKFLLPATYRLLGKNPWIEYFDLADKYKPVDLGPGIPDFAPPQYVKDALVTVANNPNYKIHQYTRGAGHLRLVNAIAKFYSNFVGREINPLTEVITSLGCYQALFLSITGIVERGDEVIVIEPFFECFDQHVKIAGGIPRYVSLTLKENTKGVTSSQDWTLDFSALEKLFNEKTKAIILNTPHNPLGKVFSYEELSHIADLCKKWNVVCISDEVYQFAVYDSKSHISIASLPDMWDRTVTVASAGKLFGATGWKLGWAYGPEHLISNLQAVHFASVLAGNSILQEAAAICFEEEIRRLNTPESYLVSSAKAFEKKRDYMYKFFTEFGFKPILSDAGYFLVADWSNLEKLIDLSEEKDKYKDYRFTKWMTKNIGVQGTPISPFFCEEHKYMAANLVRFSFVKTDAYLEKAVQALKDWKVKLN